MVGCWTSQYMSFGVDDWRQLEDCMYDAIHWLDMLVVEAGYGPARARLHIFCRIVRHWLVLSYVYW